MEKHETQSPGNHRGSLNDTPSRLIRRREVEALTGCARSTLYDYMAAGTFPAPVRLSVRAVAWKLEDVRAWIDSRPCARPAPLGKGA